MVALASDQALCALEFGSGQIGGRLDRLEKRLARWFAPFAIDEKTCLIVERTRRWLADYFAGIGANAGLLPLDVRGAPFELRVWAELRDIPPGTTVSYGEIAKRLGSAGAARAVGMANGANPIAVVIPCHRVVGASGSLTGYGGGLDRKAWLLDHERCWRRDSLF
jgi:methylated-DNA-[protein]-cysteine S-methyltransferase